MSGHGRPASALYATIHTQPDVVREVLRACADEARRAGALVAAARRVFLAGTGTSSHAAVVGEHLLRAVGVEAYATTNFDVVTYPRPLAAGDLLIAISHRGSKTYGSAAIARAREAGLPVIGITGQDSPMAGVDVLLRTAPQERSATHTASYTGNLAALALIAVEAAARAGAADASLRDAVTGLPGALETLLAREDELWPVAERLAERGRLVLAGAGPNAVTAREGALKVKESSFLTAEGFELETLLHGGLQAVEAGDIAVVIAANGPALDRAMDAVRALSVIGAQLLVIADEAAPLALPDGFSGAVVRYPSLPEPLSPAAAVIPLQLLAAFTAHLRGTDADAFRADDPAYKAAGAGYKL